MADNFDANAGSGGSTFAADEVSAVLYPRVKRVFSRDSVAPQDDGTGFRLLSAATTNATSLKASAGTLYALYVVNLNAADRYLKFYNKASGPYGRIGYSGDDSADSCQHDGRRFRLEHGSRLVVLDRHRLCDDNGCCRRRYRSRSSQRNHHAGIYV